jgi:predicted ATPase
MPLSHTARVLWVLGYPEQALQSSREALRLAQALSHLYSRVYAWFFAATIHGFRREGQTVHEFSNTVIALASEQGFPFFGALGTMAQGWSLVMQGRAAEGVVQLRQGLAALQAMGEELERLWFLTLLAEAYATRREVEEGLRVLGTTLTLVAQRGDRWWEAEMHRLQGDLLLQLSLDNQPEAESCFQQAISIAQRQRATSWELRAATSLARLWQSQGKRDEARALLEPVYSWFTEGFDTADLIDAKELLDELEGGQ